MFQYINPNPLRRGYNLQSAQCKFPLLIKEGQGWLETTKHKILTYIRLI
jgi:hypothetical protein